MVTLETLEYIRYLFENIFPENANNSKEFSTFANGNPNLLRVKVENWLAEHSTIDLLYDFNKEQEIHALVNKMSFAYELDFVITKYIEDNYDTNN